MREVANIKNIKVGSVLVCSRNCTETYYPGRRIVVDEITDSGRYIRWRDEKCIDIRNWFSSMFLDDFDVLIDSDEPEPESTPEVAVDSYIVLNIENYAYCVCTKVQLDEFLLTNGDRLDLYKIIKNPKYLTPKKTVTINLEEQE